MLLSWPAIVIPSPRFGDHAHPSQIDEEFRHLDEQSVRVDDRRPIVRDGKITSQQVWNDLAESGVLARGGTHAVTIR